MTTKVNALFLSISPYTHTHTHTHTQGDSGSIYSTEEVKKTFGWLAWKEVNEFSWWSGGGMTAKPPFLFFFFAAVRKNKYRSVWQAVSASEETLA